MISYYYKLCTKEKKEKIVTLPLELKKKLKNKLHIRSFKRQL